MNKLPSLYLPADRRGSHPVSTFLENQGISYLDRSSATLPEVSDETGIPEDRVEEQLPILKWTDGTQLPRCSRNRLVEFLRERGYEFEDS